MKNNQPFVEVGILESKVIRFHLLSTFYCKELDQNYKGEQSVIIKNNQVFFNSECVDSLHFEPLEKDNRFRLYDVVIGKKFHWQRLEEQVFEGSLFIQVTGSNQLSAINILPVENYLLSVISSEMSADASVELLKAHAVISRSWLLTKLKERAQENEIHEEPIINFEHSEPDSPERYIKWYERDAHTYYDVCADDHCQRYQGVVRASNSNVKDAIEETKGQVLMYENEICDARYSKCCGGMSELFSSCWSDKNYDYLQPVRDLDKKEEIDLCNEQAARAWILSSPKSYCNTEDEAVLKQIMNDYDQETPDFYRWRVHYSIDELSQLIAHKSGIDFGEIQSIKPILRGKSGRIYELLIQGSKKHIIVGKELEIRRWLSKTHLYSSAFIVEKSAEGFDIIGAGWGHGVGLCQIGAAMMANKGKNYTEILEHYFKGAKIEKSY